MTRIISGLAGSLRLDVPKSGTRPTSDRVREAIFSGLDARGQLEGASVLDLFAGSGALGLEALSRGASSVVLVERDAQAARVASLNAGRVLEACASGSVASARVVKKSVAAFLMSCQDVFDVVFLDPPYDLTEGELSETLRRLMPLLREGSIVIVERSTRSAEPEWPQEISRDHKKVYGETAVWIAARE